MTELLELIRSTHLARTGNIAEQKNIWLKLSGQFRPDLGLYRAGRPSMLVARETGDLGLSVLWIVQAALIRPILKNIVLKSVNNDGLMPVLNRIDSGTLCALAHSENPADPVILSESGSGFTLSGEKKFITAGRNSELMVVTCRKTGEEKISRLAVIDPAALPHGSLTDLNLEIMRSVSHTKLALKDLTVSEFMIPQIDPPAVRKMIKKWGILERALILEAFLSFLLYAEKILNSAGGEISAFEDIYSLAEMQSISVTKQVDESVYSEKIETENIPLQKLMPLVDTFKKAYINNEKGLPETERIKLRDLFLFDNLRG